MKGNRLPTRESSQSRKPNSAVISFQMAFKIPSTISLSKSVNHLKGFKLESPLLELLPPESPPGVGTGVGSVPGSGAGLGEGGLVGAGVGVTTSFAS